MLDVLGESPIAHGTGDLDFSAVVATIVGQPAVR
jgi:hypothetical protein